VTPGLYEAMTWIRDETPEDAVIAVNNQWVDPGNVVPLEFNYSAYTERRVYIEGWGYSQKSRDAGFAEVLAGENPFADRLAINVAAFAGDGDALQALESAGVDLLLIDEEFGTEADLEALERAGTVVKRTDGAVVVELGG
jgi:hypothetical protein